MLTLFSSVSIHEDLKKKVFLNHENNSVMIHIRAGRYG